MYPSPQFSARLEVDYLRGEKERLEAAIRTGKGLLQETLAQKLMVLKLARAKPKLIELGAGRILRPTETVKMLDC
jgi:hypothetical protein